MSATRTASRGQTELVRSRRPSVAAGGGIPPPRATGLGKTYHGLEHITHHHVNSLLMGWLLTIFAITIERLYRLRYLHRGRHRPVTAIAFVRALRLSLAPPRRLDTS